MYDPAHSDYTLLTATGSFIKEVRNARDELDPEPTVVPLPPGLYQIRADAEGPNGTEEVRVPVLIQAGQTTRAHLMGDWKPRRHYEETDVVRLPDGEIAGWVARR